ncbi:LiaF transmembrane domain-containing protein [Halomicrobium urmianum]|uniref:LiaF transmembrane domain-containing protein n=1 Tax=Halomicrobium urmianum TaxID=1586233 RepID=UPI001CD99095|nr:LiaF domain-containing protein [Halomicrobium urmianum]
MSTARRRVPTQVLFGLAVLLAGLLLLLDTTGTYDTSVLWRFVPSLFVLLGLYAIAVSGFRNLFGPVVVVIVAGLWQLSALGLVDAAELGSLWPLLVVLFGLSLLLSHYRRSPAATPDSHVSSMAVLGGSETRVTTDQFTGADLTALFGAATVDLRDATVPEKPAHVNAIAMFGGVEIVVPREWNVRLDVLPILGGVSDDRVRSADVHDEVDLVVTGLVAFGGVAVED